MFREPNHVISAPFYFLSYDMPQHEAETEESQSIYRQSSLQTPAAETSSISPNSKAFTVTTRNKITIPTTTRRPLTSPRYLTSPGRSLGQTVSWLGTDTGVSSPRRAVTEPRRAAALAAGAIPSAPPGLPPPPRPAETSRGAHRPNFTARRWSRLPGRAVPMETPGTGLRRGARGSRCPAPAPWQRPAPPPLRGGLTASPGSRASQPLSRRAKPTKTLLLRGKKNPNPTTLKGGGGGYK